MEDKVVVVNATSGRVGMTVPELRFHRVWNGRGAKISIDKDLLREAIYTEGVRTLFEEGLLQFDDMAFKKEIGLEPEDAEGPTNILPLDEKIMDRLLSRMPIYDFKTEFKKYSKPQQLDIINYAVAHDIINLEKSDYIKEITGCDIIKMITNKRSNAEETKENDAV